MSMNYETTWTSRRISSLWLSAAVWAAMASAGCEGFGAHASWPCPKSLAWCSVAGLVFLPRQQGTAMNPRFIPPARHASTGRSRVNSRSRPAESLSAESPASQTRRKLEELAIELGAKNSGAATSQISPGQRDSALASSSQLGLTPLWFRSLFRHN